MLAFPPIFPYNDCDVCNYYRHPQPKSNRKDVQHDRFRCLHCLRCAHGCRCGRHCDPPGQAGALYPFHPVELAACPTRPCGGRVESARVEDVVWGVVTHWRPGANLAQLALLRPASGCRCRGVAQPHVRVSQQAVHFTAQAILAGDMDIVSPAAPNDVPVPWRRLPAEFPDVGLNS
jgi:hypothetical protein